MGYALNNNGMPQRFCKRESVFTASLSQDPSVCRDHPAYDGFWTPRGPTPPGPMAAWLRVLTSSHTLDRQRRKKGDHVLIPSQSWLAAFNFSISTSITSQQLLQHFAGGSDKRLETQSTYVGPDIQDMSHHFKNFHCLHRNLAKIVYQSQWICLEKVVCQQRLWL